MLIFKSKGKKVNDILEIKLSGKRIYPAASVSNLYNLNNFYNSVYISCPQRNMISTYRG